MTLLNTTAGASGLTPQEWGALIIEPLRRRSLALNELCATQVTTPHVSYHVPVITADTGASWVAEGSEIPLSQPTLNEIIVTPSKCAQVVTISSELANDSTPSATAQVGDSLAGSLAQAVDAAFFGNVASPAPAGLGALLDANVSRVFTGVTPTNFDKFTSVIALVESDAATLTCWCCNPNDWAMLAQIKTGSSFNSTLVNSDVQAGTAKQLMGLPVFTSPQITAGTMYGLARDRVVTVLREDITLDVSQHAMFTSDRLAVKATVRIGFCFPTPKSVARVAFAAS